MLFNWSIVVQAIQKIKSLDLNKQGGLRYRNPPCFNFLFPVYPRKVLLLLALFASMVESRTSPQQVHFQASKERTKS